MDHQFSPFSPRKLLRSLLPGIRSLAHLTRSQSALAQPLAPGRGERICIAAAPEHPDGKQKSRWVVTCAGKTRLASHVEIRTAFDPSAEPAGNEAHAIYVCTGSISWQGSTAVIT